MVAVGDNPITEASEDVLGRTATARDLAEEILAADVSEGCVVGIMGPWGSGKTSLINLIRRELGSSDGAPVLDFNPWLFSGAEQLVESFFRELAAQLRMKKGRLSDIAAEVEAYGDLLAPLGMIPVVGAWFGMVRTAATGFRKLQERRRGSVTDQRAKLAAALEKLEQRIVVVVDDIDRLQTNEIRDIFKLVRLTASFPKIVYVLAFDRKRIEDALTETGIDGRSYLEKIVQISVDIPKVPESLLLSQLARVLDAVFDEFGGPILFNEARWVDILAEIIYPHIRNMRDVRRFAASIRGAIRALNGRVENADLLGIEAIRIFAPDLFSAIVAAQSGLTNTERISFRTAEGTDPERQSLEHLLEAAESRELGQAVVHRLFPAGLRFVDGTNYGPEWQREWIRDRRLAHPDVLSLYLQRVANERMEAFSDAERAFALLGDEEAFARFMQGIDLTRREDVIAALENYEGVYLPETVPSAVAVLLNVLSELPERRRGFFDFDARLVVGRVILRMLRKLADTDVVEHVVDEVLPRLTTLSSQLELIRTVGYEDGVGHKLVTNEFADQKERGFGEVVYRVEVSALAREWNLLRLLFWSKKRDPEFVVSRDMADDPQFNAQLLLKASSQARIQMSGNRAVSRETRLAWEPLVQLYGGEEKLRSAIELARTIAADNVELAEVIELAERYLGGWRPEEF